MNFGADSGSLCRESRGTGGTNSTVSIPQWGHLTVSPAADSSNSKCSEQLLHGHFTSLNHPAPFPAATMRPYRWIAGHHLLADTLAQLVCRTKTSAPASFRVT